MLFSKKDEFKIWILLMLLLNGLTHPMIWFLVPNWWNHYWLKLIISEIFVFSAELILCNQIKNKLKLNIKNQNLKIILANTISLLGTFYFK
jgi:hypothetical protein